MSLSPPVRPTPDADGLLWGFQGHGHFRAVVRAGVTQPDGLRGKWISFLPAALPSHVRQSLFDELGRLVLLDPHSLSADCHNGKMAVRPVIDHPDKVALMFYSRVDLKENLKPLLQAHARSVRQRCIAQGLLEPNDGFLGRWFYKTDAQTTQELARGTHVSQRDLIHRVMAAFPSPPSIPKKPR